MPNLRTIVGLLVLGLVVAGVYWVRSRSMAPQEAATMSSAEQVLGDEALPDVTLADGAVDAGDVRITLSLAPQPPAAFAKFRVRVSAFALAPTATASAKATADSRVTLQDGKISFEMTMPMGDHRYALVPGGEGWQEAEVVLPLCPSGKRRWYATVEGTAAGRPVNARFRLDLAVPQAK